MRRRGTYEFTDGGADLVLRSALLVATDEPERVALVVTVVLDAERHLGRLLRRHGSLWLVFVSYACYLFIYLFIYFYSTG